MSKIELFITGLRSRDTIDLPNAGFEQIIKEAVSSATRMDVNDVDVSFAENDVIEIKLPLSFSDDAGNLGNTIAALLDPLVASRLEWTEIRISRARP
jgi:hypothetical protein